MSLISQTYAYNPVRFGNYNFPILNDPIGMSVKYAKEIDKSVVLPKMGESIYRSTMLQQKPCVTINDVTFPNAKVSNISKMNGYKSIQVDRNTKIDKTNVIGYFPKQFPLDTPLLKPASMFHPF